MRREQICRRLGQTAEARVSTKALSLAGEGERRFLERRWQNWPEMESRCRFWLPPNDYLMSEDGKDATKPEYLAQRRKGRQVKQIRRE
jgi:hypothetical protein